MTGPYGGALTVNPITFTLTIMLPGPPDMIPIPPLAMTCDADPNQILRVAPRTFPETTTTTVEPADPTPVAPRFTG